MPLLQAGACVYFKWWPGDYLDFRCNSTPGWCIKNISYHHPSARLPKTYYYLFIIYLFFIMNFKSAIMTFPWLVTQPLNSQRFKTNQYSIELFIYKISRYKILFSSINMKWRTHKRQSLIDKYVNINNSIRTMHLNIQVSLNIFTQPNILLFIFRTIKQ